MTVALGGVAVDPGREAVAVELEAGGATAVAGLGQRKGRGGDAACGREGIVAGGGGHQGCTPPGKGCLWCASLDVRAPAREERERRREEVRGTRGWRDTLYNASIMPN